MAGVMTRLAGKGTARESHPATQLCGQGRGAADPGWQTLLCGITDANLDIGS